jgi:glycosyltransferase involved in cell wall biosynthesis
VVSKASGPDARPRAVVLVGGPAAPYSRALRIARSLAGIGYAVEIAAIAARGLPERETLGASGATTGPIERRRYRPSGIWAVLGRSGATGGSSPPARGTAAGDRSGGRTGGRATLAQSLRRVATPFLEVRRWLLWPHPVRGWWATLSRDLPPADLYHACGVLGLPPALRQRDRASAGARQRRAVVIYDAIDDVAGSNRTMSMPPPVRRIIAKRERGWARRADGRVTVNQTLAARLAARWGTPAVAVVPNVPEEADPALVRGARDRLRAVAGLDASARIVLFQGRLGPGRGLEAAAEAVLAVPQAVLVILGFGAGFETTAARDVDPRFRGRHVTLPAVPPDELPGLTAGADVMVIPLPPISPNQRASTPNKFWEAIAVGVPVVVVRGLDELVAIVEEHDLGVVAASAAPGDLAVAISAALDRLDRDGDAWRTAIAATSRERFGWPSARAAYLDLVGRVTGEPITGPVSSLPDSPTR